MTSKSKPSPTPSRWGCVAAVCWTSSGNWRRTAAWIRTGALKPTARFLTASGRTGLARSTAKPVFRIADPVYLSQKDVRQVQLAKAAVRAAIELLLRSHGLLAAQVDRVLVAASFGFHLRTASLIHLGLLPREFKEPGGVCRQHVQIRCPRLFAEPTFARRTQTTCATRSRARTGQRSGVRENLRQGTFILTFP